MQSDQLLDFISISHLFLEVALQTFVFYLSRIFMQFLWSLQWPIPIKHFKVHVSLELTLHLVELDWWS